MRRILEYPLAVGLPVARVRMPIGATVLHAHEQHGMVCVWAAGDPDAEHTDRAFAQIMTGEEALTDGRYVGTCHLTAPSGAPFVLHIYDLEGVTQ